MGSGREGSPAMSGGSDGTTEEKNSSRLGPQGIRWAEPGVGSTTSNLRRSGGKEVVEGGSVVARVEAFNSSLRKSSDAAADVAPAAADSGANAGMKSSRKGPTRSNSAGSGRIAAKEVEAVGSVVEAKLGRQDGSNASSRSHLKSVSFNGIGDLKGKEMADGGRSPGQTRVVEFSDLQDQSNGLGRLSRSKTGKSPIRRIRGGSQESFPDQVMETRSLSKIRSRVGSPKRNRTEEDDLQDILADMVHDQSGTPETSSHIRISKSIRQGSKSLGQDVSNEVPSKISEVPSRNFRNLTVGAETREESQARATGRRSKTTRRHTKRKPDEANDLSPEEAAEVAVADHQPSAKIKEPRQPSSRISKARASTPPNSTPGTWMHVLGDVIMWKDIPRSTLYFGAGCFGILSTSYAKSTSFGALTLTSYLALVYLAGIYCHRSYLRGGQVGDGVHWELSDLDVLDMVRVVLPAVNLVISKCGQLFCGDPYTTLKVAAMLWVLAQLGYWISLWSFARLAFIAVFIVPKLFSYYSHQLQGHAEAVAERVWIAWEEYAHKKGAVVGAFLVTWNFTSASTRLFAAFIVLVAVRAYYGQLVEEEMPGAAHNGVEENHQDEGLPPIDTPAIQRLPRTFSPLKDVKGSSDPSSGRSSVQAAIVTRTAYTCDLDSLAAALSYSRPPQMESA